LGKKKQKKPPPTGGGFFFFPLGEGEKKKLSTLLEENASLGAHCVTLFTVSAHVFGGGCGGEGINDIG